MTDDLDDALEHENAAARPRLSHPKGWEPGFEWDGAVGVITTGPLEERPKTWDAFIRDAGLDPDEVEVVEPVQVRGWDTAVAKIDPETGKRVTDIVRARYYRVNTRRRRLTVNVDHLLARLKGVKAVKQDPVLDRGYVDACGDLQLGKIDGDGVDGTVRRFLDTSRASVDRYKRLTPGRPAHLFHLGDCIEGMVAQGGANTWRTTLTTTDQVSLYETLVLEQLKMWAPVAPRIVLAGIPGNHDEAHRPIHRYGDSWALQSLGSVKRALDLAGRFGHISVHTPARDELTLTYDVSGTIFALAHGHQFRGGWQRWWEQQALGRQPVGDADVLLAGHLHHLVVVRQNRTFIQVPALESESTWFRHTHGVVSEPGRVTLVAAGGGWSQLEVL